MATTIAAMKGKLGSTDYFVVVMKAKELVEKAIIPSEMDDWETQTLEEKEQRDINYTRVKNQIAPYLANDKDRFFGSIILTAKGLTIENFEPIAEVATKGLPHLYKTTAKAMGFLTLEGGEQLIPLDGQHRLKAIQFAIEGKDEKDRVISGMSACSDLANEDVTVILIPHDQKKSRKIFTKVNRYAKPTTTGQNLVTDDDDFIAVSARMIANNEGIIGANLVKYKSNALADKEKFFTTLATIAECNNAIVEEFFGSIDRTCPIGDLERQNLYEEKINEVWEHLTENIKIFSAMLADKTPDGDEKRQEIREDYLLGKPVPQVCIFKAFIYLVNSNKYTYKEASDILNKIDWKKDAELWDRLLMSGSKIITKNGKIATRIIYYIAGGDMDKKDEDSLLEDYKKLFPHEEQNDIVLPEKVS